MILPNLNIRLLKNLFFKKSKLSTLNQHAGLHDYTHLMAQANLKKVGFGKEGVKYSVIGSDSNRVTKADTELFFPNDAVKLGPILNNIRRGAMSSSLEHLCIEIMKYTTSSIKLGMPEGMKCASEVFEDQVCSCGGFANVFCDLARLAGIPARYVGFFGLPEVGSHALAEAFYDGRWHLYDATFGVFCYSKQDYDGKGHILSATEIATQAHSPTLMQVLKEPWKLNYEEERTFRPQPLLDPPTSHVLEYWPENGRKSMFPVCIGDRATVTFPVVIDLTEDRVYQLGVANGQWRDTYTLCTQNTDNGYSFIGSGGPKFYHYVRVKAKAYSDVLVTYHATPESIAKLDIMPLASCFLMEQDEDGLQTQFTFRTNSDECAFLILTDGAYWIDTFRYEIISVPNIEVSL